MPKHIDSLENLLSTMQINFDVIAISETRITNHNKSSHNLDINNYNFDFCATDSTAGGTALYIKNSYSYTSRPDLTMYKSKELKSNFIEINIPKKLI